MPMPKDRALHRIPPAKAGGRGRSPHIRLGWGLDAVSAGDADRGLRGKLRRSSNAQAVKNISSQHLALLLLHSLQGRSSQPLCFWQAGWGLVADFNPKPSPGDEVIVPFFSILRLAGAVSVAVLSHSPSTPHSLYEKTAKPQKPGKILGASLPPGWEGGQANTPLCWHHHPQPRRCPAPS